METAARNALPLRFHIEERMAKFLRNEVFAHMRETRGVKYRGWLIGLSAVKFLFPARYAAELLLTVYAAMRMADDYVDGDRPLPREFTSPAEYIDSLMEFMEGFRQPHNPSEYLLGYAARLMEESGFDLRNEVVLVLRSLRFDAERKNHEPRLFLRDELWGHFRNRDIGGVITACLKLTRDHDKGVRAEDLAELGEIVQIRYNLRDVFQDWEAGFCNIPLESLRTPEGSELLDTHRLPLSLVERWAKDEVRRGRVLLERYKKKRRSVRLSWRTRVALYLVFERPAERYFARLQ